jgi:hypothetical protein
MAMTSGWLRSRLGHWAQERADDDLLRWLFGAMLTATVAVLALDYAKLSGFELDQATLPGLRTELGPLPSVRPDSGDEDPPLTEGNTRGRMSFELMDNGRLIAAGTISPGTAKAFAAEIEKRGSYVKTVVLHSPGGSVSDALQMGLLIRQKGFATEVEAGRYCASSCPLVFAGGIERRVGNKAAIGVHQVFAAVPTGMPAGGEMNGAQRISAECQKYLRDMGVDLEVWIHAMETPKERLYYFKPAEMLTLKLATHYAGRTSLVAKEAQPRS